jgi:Aldo/keto reductase family
MAGIDRPVVSQPYYNLLNRMPEVEHLPACAHYGLGVAPYSPLARGVLTGKYAADHAPAGDTQAGRHCAYDASDSFGDDGVMTAAFYLCRATQTPYRDTTEGTIGVRGSSHDPNLGERQKVGAPVFATIGHGGVEQLAGSIA